MDLQPKKILLAVAALVLSAAAWFYSTGLHPHWILTWLAPLPVLLAAPRLSRKWAFTVAFLGFAFGALNLRNYILHVIGLPHWLMLVVVWVPALVFGLIVLLHRRFILRGQLVRAAFVLPVLWVAFEYLTEFHSANSTWANMGYTQMNLLPLIQSASVTGIWAISFVVFLFAGTVVALATPSGRKSPLIVVAVIYAVVFGYGSWRLLATPTAPTIKVALMSDDPVRAISPRGPETVALAEAYAAQIPATAAQGARVVVIPEKIGHIQPSELPQVDARFERLAREYRLTIVVGFKVLPNLNQARIYSPDGELEATYEKHHMIPVLEPDLPGTARVVLPRSTGKWGIEICKDMDFPQLSRQYGREGVGLMLVPAWDFGVDGWRHGSMAILRGVESGFSIARAAKRGLLTVTDGRGRVLAGQSSAAQAGSPNAPFSVLVASVPVLHVPTLYDRAGNWFAWFDLLLAAVLLVSVKW